MVIAYIQLLVTMVLALILMFGIGFILNMLLKTTWFPIYLYIIVIIPLMIWGTWDNADTFVDNFKSFTIIDILPAVTALIGAYVSGWSIRALRRGGYKMF
ncbi:YuiB family protein [Paenibacillus xylaniclasticus]|uniref:YuiB family protein n=1 Tax=Paenibacillus xylaniclasticus TaxID=588083 RepID=UPI00157FB241|nr:MULTISPECIES: YuiB family protein [Paenibacillus]GFN31257.1 hypothetical protein PCURB6_15170 [Paenibacillus curdlanolyticus]